MSNKLIKSIKTANPDIGFSILSFIDPEIAMFHEYFLKEFPYKERVPLNIAKEIANDTWDDKQSLIFIYKETDKPSVFYFMIKHHDDKESFVIRYGDFDSSYNHTLYSNIKGKSKETLEDYMSDVLSDIVIEPSIPENDKKGIKNMIPIETLVIPNDQVNYHVMNHIYSFFDDTFSVYRLDMMKYGDNRAKSSVILDQRPIYYDIESCIKNQENVVIVIPNDIVNIEYTYILGKYYDGLFHIELGWYNKFSHCSKLRYTITTKYPSKNPDFITAINDAVFNFNLASFVE